LNGTSFLTTKYNFEERIMKKADLHVHTKYSKYVAITTRLLKMVGARECYNEPEDVYLTAKERGMDYVPITDHDTIEAAQILNDKYPDIIIGEELQVKAFDEGDLIHILALGINEKIHYDLEHLKKIGLEKTINYLKKRDIAHITAHIAHSASTKPLSLKFINKLMKYTDIIEAHNGEVTAEENITASFFADIYKKKKTAGSDAHTLYSVGKVFTGVPNNAGVTKEDFLEAIKHGKCWTYPGLPGMTLKRLIKEANTFIKNIYKESFICPGQKMKDTVINHILHYFILLMIALPAATSIPSLFISANYRRGQKKKTQKLQKEILEFILKRRQK